MYPRGPVAQNGRLVPVYWLISTDQALLSPDETCATGFSISGTPGKVWQEPLPHRRSPWGVVISGRLFILEIPSSTCGSTRRWGIMVWRRAFFFVCGRSGKRALRGRYCGPLWWFMARRLVEACYCYRRVGAFSSAFMWNSRPYEMTSWCVLRSLAQLPGINPSSSPSVRSIPTF